MLEKEKGVQEIEGIVILVILRRFQLPDMYCGEGMTDLILVVTEG
jgi:hypothetical protein